MPLGTPFHQDAKACNHWTLGVPAGSSLVLCPLPSGLDPQQVASLCWASALVTVKWADEVLFQRLLGMRISVSSPADLHCSRDQEVATITPVPAPGCRSSSVSWFIFGDWRMERVMEILHGFPASGILRHIL